MNVLNSVHLKIFKCYEFFEIFGNPSKKPQHYELYGSFAYYPQFYTQQKMFSSAVKIINHSDVE